MKFTNILIYTLLVLIVSYFSYEHGMDVAYTRLNEFTGKALLQCIELIKRENKL